MISLKEQGGISHNQAVVEASPSRIVAKPVPEAANKDPRGYQLGQLRKRYSPKESTSADGTTSLVFRLTPSDPDFPFELDYLDCDVRVPAGYPEEPASLHVKNRNIPRGFGINIERGWDRLVRDREGATLLALTYALDKNLESFLSEQKVETVKFVTFKDTRHLDAAALKEAAPSEAERTAHSPIQPPKPYFIEESFTRDEIAAAKERRAQETRQIEARMGRLSLYRKSADGIVYTVPFEPKRRFELPAGLQAVMTLHLIIPLLYPLQPLRIQLNEVGSTNAEPLEEMFVQKAIEQKHLSLMGHVNYLAQNMHTLAKQAEDAIKAEEAKKIEVLSQQPQEESKGKTTDTEFGSLGEKSHIKVIPRPPEWTVIRSEDAEGSSDDYSYDSGETSDEGGAALERKDSGLSVAATSTPERGTSISFPSIELHGIELLQVSVLAVSVRCARCKAVNEVSGLKHGVEKADRCRKCATPFAATYRQELIHQLSSRAGFLDLSGCTVADMLPSTFIPVCATCSTPSPGLVSVRGETTRNICRECHGKFTFKIPDVKFLAITPGAAPPPAAAGMRRKPEKLGLRAGEPLPNRGACAHYRKSYRWFRFACCQKVYPCDRCHDEEEHHELEWANRMVCGFCSREQRYNGESCGFCGRSVVGTKGKGFWEGGKGTRDRTMMSRKDKRKHRRVGGGEASKN
jgi:uncharacterized CHY-type Zn-finger protein